MLGGVEAPALEFGCEADARHGQQRPGLKPEKRDGVGREDLGDGRDQTLELEFARERVGQIGADPAQRPVYGRLIDHERNGGRGSGHCKGRIGARCEK